MAESEIFDFKEAQYKFYGATVTDDEKSELLKDILAFANTSKTTDAFIVIGVSEEHGRKNTVVGLTALLKDNDIQQFVNSKTNRPVKFLVYSDKADGLDISVIQIAENQKRPLFLKAAFGKLKFREVYIRSGSSTAIASPDQIAEMAELKLVRVVGVCVLLAVFISFLFWLNHSSYPTHKTEIFSLIPRELTILLDKPRYLLAWNINGREVVSPIHVSIFADFTNLKDTPLTIRSYQFEGRTPKGNWELMPTIDIRLGRLLWLTSTNFDLKQVVLRVDCGTNVFPSVLCGRTIGPGDTIPVWIFLEAPKNGFDGNMRLRIRDANDTEFVREVKQATAVTNYLNATIQGGGRSLSREIGDISKFPVIRYSDE